MEKTKKIHNVILLDRSGSMWGYEDATITSFNEKIQEMKTNSKEVDTSVTFVTFNHDINYHNFNESTDHIEELNSNGYKPNGSTALRSCIKHVIDRIRNDTDDIENETVVLFSIISDGEDTSSYDVTQSQVAELIQEVKDKYKWIFTYIGTDHDLEKVSRNFNIPKGNILSFNKTDQGIKDTSAAQNNTYRSFVTQYSNSDLNTKDGFLDSVECAYFSDGSDIADASELAKDVNPFQPMIDKYHPCNTTGSEKTRLKKDITC